MVINRQSLEYIPDKRGNRVKRDKAGQEDTLLYVFGWLSETLRRYSRSTIRYAARRKQHENRKKSMFKESICHFTLLKSQDACEFRIPYIVLDSMK